MSGHTVISRWGSMQPIGFAIKDADSETWIRWDPNAEEFVLGLNGDELRIPYKAMMAIAETKPMYHSNKRSPGTMGGHYPWE